MEIRVEPRMYFEQMNDNTLNNLLKEYYIISINTPEHRPTRFEYEYPPFTKEHLKNNRILVLYFHDWWIPNDKTVVYFNENMARKIHNFIDDNNVKKLIVHCTAGFSRSAAVGFVLNEYYNKIKEENINDYNTYNNNYKQSTCPNQLVVEKLMREYNLENKNIEEYINGIKILRREIVKKRLEKHKTAKELFEDSIKNRMRLYWSDED